VYFNDTLLADKTSLSDKMSLSDATSSSEKEPLSDNPGLSDKTSRRSLTERLDSIDSHVWVILLSAMISGTVTLSILLLQKDRASIHPYIRLWAISVWPAILGTIFSSLRPCSRARREWKGYGEVEHARFFRGIWWRWVQWSVVALLAVGWGYFERGGG